jgi:hypothetical protein
MEGTEIRHSNARSHVRIMTTKKASDNDECFDNDGTLIISENLFLSLTTGLSSNPTGSVLIPSLPIPLATSLRPISMP